MVWPGEHDGTTRSRPSCRRRDLGIHKTLGSHRSLRTPCRTLLSSYASALVHSAQSVSRALRMTFARCTPRDTLKTSNWTTLTSLVLQRIQSFSSFGNSSDILVHHRDSVIDLGLNRADLGISAIAWWAALRRFDMGMGNPAES